MVSGTSRSLWSLAKTYMGVRNYSPLFMLGDNKSAAGYHLGHLVSEPSLFTPVIEELCRLYVDGKIKPIIDSVWAFEDVGHFSSTVVSYMHVNYDKWGKVKVM